jgi:hypothetical protein
MMMMMMNDDDDDDDDDDVTRVRAHVTGSMPAACMG